MSRSLLFVGVLFWSICIGKLAAYAQEAIPIGSWRTHFSYQQVQQILPAQNRIYAASARGLFYLDKEDQTLTTLSTVSGLSDIGVTAMAFDKASGAVLLAYQSGIIDVFYNNRVYPFTLIAESGSDERIHHLDIQGDTVFVSSTLGIRVLTLQNNELSIQESYTNLGQTGDELSIYASTILRDSIFLATEEGILANALSPTVNKQNFQSWKRLMFPGVLPGTAVSKIAQLNGMLYVGIDQFGLYQQSGTGWSSVLDFFGRDIQSLTSLYEQLVVVANDSVYTFGDGESQVYGTTDGVDLPVYAVTDESGDLWVGERNLGLLRVNDASVSYIPNGPTSDSLASVHFTGDYIFGLAPSADLSGAFGVFSEGKWNNTYGQGLDTPFPIRDVAYLPSSETYYFPTYGGGLLSWNFTDDPVLLRAEEGAVPFDNNDLTSVATDIYNNVWITDFNSSQPLHKLITSDQSWQSLPVAELSGRYPTKVVIAQDGNPWVLQAGTDNPDDTGDDVLIVNQENGDYIFLKDHISGGSFAGSEITDMVVDQEGLIWFGGSEGVSYCINPWEVFSGVLLERPVFENQYLLLGEYVTCMAVDGGNNKWVGTKNGLWLFNSTGEEQLAYFTKENSPIIDNYILDIAINDTDGEVFILTSKGLVSYRGKATKENENHDMVKIFPNPVLPGFSGTVGIQGLVAEASVKITTLSGTLVRELKAEGGSATWDVLDYSGNRVNTGIYLIFSADESGEETFVGKVAVTN